MRPVRSYVAGGECFFGGVSRLGAAGAECKKTRARRVFSVAEEWFESVTAVDGRSEIAVCLRVWIAVEVQVSAAAEEPALTVVEEPA